MTTSEVVRFSGVKLNTPPCSFEELFTIEYHEGRLVLGEALWESMREAVADYSSESSWAEGTYNQGDIVLHRWTYYQATTTTTAQPPKAPDWEVAPKFEGSCQAVYDDFFCQFWAPYLAKRILTIRLPYIRTQIDGLGVLEYSGGAYDTSNPADYDALKSAVSRDAAMALGNLKFFMSKEAQTDEDCLAGYLGYQTDECDDGTKKPKTRRSQTGIYRFG